MYVCLCNSVTDHDIQAALEEGADDLALLQKKTGVATGCGSCRSFTESLIDAARNARKVASAPEAR